MEQETTEGAEKTLVSMETLNRISHAIIGAAIEVHKVKGPGLLESVYQKCLSRELKLRGISAVREHRVPLEYKGDVLDEYLVLDFLVEGLVVVELKAVEAILPIHKAQVLSYMKTIDARLGLLINFNELCLKDGIHRLINNSSQ
jgi:GxxExxY protein